MNPVLAVLIDAQVKSHQKRTRLGKVTQVKGFERKGQKGRVDPQQQSDEKSKNVALARKATPDDKSRILAAAHKAKRALSKGMTKEARVLAKEFYRLKRQLLRKHQLASTSKAA